MNFENWNHFLKETLGDRYKPPAEPMPPPKDKQEHDNVNEEEEIHAETI